MLQALLPVHKSRRGHEEREGSLRHAPSRQQQRLLGLSGSSGVGHDSIQLA